MANIRNICLLGAATLLTCAALGTRFVDKVVWDFPEGCGVGEEYSYMEGRSMSPAPRLSLSSFALGEFQDATESFVADSLPFRDQAILLNAGLQRAAVAQASALMGYDTYPTYFDSSRLYIRSADAVTYLPGERTEYMDQKVREYAQGIAQMAARYPSKTFVVYVVGGYQEPAANPAYDLVTSPYRPQDAVEGFAEVLASVPNVKVLTDEYASVEEYYRDFYRSDHHWNARGALRAYNTVADALGLEAVDLDTLSYEEARDGFVFSGATARWGRDLVEDEVFVADTDYSDVTYAVGEGTADGNDHGAFFSLPDYAARFTFYDAYYNAVPDGAISGPGEGSALLVSNSYGGAIQRQLAMQYQTLGKSVALWPGYSGPGLDELMGMYDAGTVIFVANPTDYMNAAALLPDFFD